jgi:hypothetical protein
MDKNSISIILAVSATVISFFALLSEGKRKDLIEGISSGIISTLSIPILTLWNKEVSFWSIMRVSAWLTPFLTSGYCLLLAILFVLKNPYEVTSYGNALVALFMGRVMFVYFRTAYKLSVS